MNALLTAAITLAGAVILFVFNQWIQRFYFEPLHEQRKVIGEVDYLLMFWAPQFTNPSQWDALSSEQRSYREKGSEALRDVACGLVATTNAVGAYWLATRSPSRAETREAARCLIGIANSMDPETGSGRETGKENKDDAQRVRKLLRLKIDPTGP